MIQTIPSPRARRAGLVAGCLLLCAHLPAQTYTASPISAGSSTYGQYPYNFTGVILVPQRNDPLVPRASGSGAVVKNPRVVFSCAHVVFDKASADPWQANLRWYRAQSPSSLPSISSGQLLRG